MRCPYSYRDEKGTEYRCIYEDGHTDLCDHYSDYIPGPIPAPDKWRKAWIQEPKKENSISDQKPTQPLWKLQPHHQEKSLIESAFPTGKGNPSPLSQFLVAFRGWKYESGNLVSVGVSGVWPKNEPIHAKCTRIPWGDNGPGGKHDAPFSGCQCGVWCFKDPKVLVRRVQTYFSRGVNGCLGSIAIWGKVIETKEGYRAEWAYPLSLETYGLTLDEQMGLVDSYGVSVKEIMPNPEEAKIQREKEEREKRDEESRNLGIWLPGGSESGEPGSGTGD